MSYEIVKSVSFDFSKKSISLTSASSNVTPKTYSAWSPTASGHDFDEWLYSFAYSCFGGMAKFMPSCRSKAHEAYLRACDACGLEAGWCGPRVKCEYNSNEYKATFEKWFAVFADFLENGKASSEKFTVFVKDNGRAVDVTVRQNAYGGWTGTYRYVSCPKKISWVQKKYIEDNFDKFGFAVA